MTEGLSAPLVYINGQLLTAESARVSVFDSGLNFADGVFEGIRVYNRRVFRLGEHVRRLYASAKAFSISIPMPEQEFQAEIIRWLRASGVGDGFHFRPIVTRGERHPPRLDPRFAQGSTVIFLGGAIEDSEAPIRAVLSTIRRTSPDALDPRIKSLNYGNNLLARLDAQRRGFDDAVMLDARGNLAEATGANLFLVSEGRLLTPRCWACLEGITRQAVLELAAGAGIPASEADLGPDDLRRADEIFITGTGSEVTSVVELDGAPVSDGRIGPVTRRLRTLYLALVRSAGTIVAAS